LRGDKELFDGAGVERSQALLGVGS
jgi:hypothetical protein